MFSKIKISLIVILLALVASCGKNDGVAGKARVLFSSVVAGAQHTCATMADSRVTCWGFNGYGQLGLGHEDNVGDDETDFRRTDIYVNLGAGRTATQLSLGYWHTCALLDNSTVKCWGNNDWGQLGQGNFTHLGDDASEVGDGLPAVSLGTGRTAKAISVGADHSCAILDNDSLKCWGYNLDGQLGLGDTTFHGDNSNEMGDNLAVVNLGVGRTAKAVATGPLNTCAILDNNALKCWGDNSQGQLGQGNTTAVGTSAAGEIAALTAINLGTGRYAVSVTVGLYHACAILDNGALKCWGNGQQGQLGLGSTAVLGDGGGEMGDALTAVNLGTGRTAISVHAQNFSTCALLDNGTVKCWGYNVYGNLGQGSVAYLGDNGSEMGDNLSPVSLGTSRTATSLTTGQHHACVLLDNFFVKCWGQNQVAQLGLGDTINRGDDSGEMGDNLPAVNEQNLHN